MKMGIKLFLILALALLVVATCTQADTVTKVTRGSTHCFRVTANAAGRPPAATGDIYDFHISLDKGTVVSHSSPDGWTGNHGKRWAVWKTSSRPISFRKGQTRGGFCIKVHEAAKVTWWTTAQDGAIITQGNLNIP